MAKRLVLSNPMTLRQMPSMSDWQCERLDSDRFIARRLAKLTDYQLLNGCLDEVQAVNSDELWLLCDAQTRLSERIALAESLRRCGERS
ncbi:hypothetical protein [Actinomadura geliboluensis]|uniref:Uncharacterized protein n=1 Tax=Actinomadura geliboluensis TaxID=882440 RepID=A0A5S4HA52_9ACTN|nr:hypothetical protein [Actinomadura geliboluensis]TMR42113.1 hypothetical protein ETD96_02070 [Actinomadura geliboluensis]